MPSAIAIDACLGERESIDEGAAHSTGLCLGDILGIGGQNLFALARIVAAMADSAASFCSLGASASHARGAARTDAEVGHQRGQIGCAVESFRAERNISVYVGLDACKAMP